MIREKEYTIYIEKEREGFVQATARVGELQIGVLGIEQGDMYKKHMASSVSNSLDMIREMGPEFFLKFDNMETNLEANKELREKFPNGLPKNEYPIIDLT